jgi:protein-S-isoprenylcysteine O-methyltransferase Ste14
MEKGRLDWRRTLGLGFFAAIAFIAILLVEVLALRVMLTWMGGSFTPEWVGAVGPLAVAAGGVVLSIAIRTNKKE